MYELWRLGCRPICQISVHTDVTSSVDLCLWKSCHKVSFIEKLPITNSFFVVKFYFKKYRPYDIVNVKILCNGPSLNRGLATAISKQKASRDMRRRYAAVHSVGRITFICPIHLIIYCPSLPITTGALLFAECWLQTKQKKTNELICCGQRRSAHAPLISENEKYSVYKVFLITLFLYTITWHWKITANLISK